MYANRTRSNLPTPTTPAERKSAELRAQATWANVQRIQRQREAKDRLYRLAYHAGAIATLVALFYAGTI